MTTLAERLQTDLTDAMKARDDVRVATLRMAIAAVKEAAVAGSAAKDLDDAEVEAVLRTQVKRRDEAAEAFREGGRDEQVARELAEREVLAAYLPKGLDEEELAAIVDAALADGGFTEPWIFMVDAGGTIVGRWDNVPDLRQIETQLEALPVDTGASS